MTLWEWDPNTSHNHILINNKTIKNHTKGKHCAFSAESISFGKRRWRIKMMNKVDYICIGIIHNPEHKHVNETFWANAENGKFWQGGGEKYSFVTYYKSSKYLRVNDVVIVDLDCDAGILGIDTASRARVYRIYRYIDIINKNVNYHLAVCLFNKDDSVQFIEEKKVVVRVSGQKFREINAHYSYEYDTYPNNIPKIKLFLCGYCRLNSRVVPSAIIQLIYVYYSIFYEWDQPQAHSTQEHFQELNFLMNNMRVRRTRNFNDIHKIYAFGTKIISINNNNKNLLHKWNLTLSARHKSGGHVCCGIGIMNVNDIQDMSYLTWSNFRETFFNWDSKIMPIHDIYLKSGHGIYAKYTKQINKFIGIECVLCRGLRPPVPDSKSGNLVEAHFGHCLNDREVIQNATTNDLTTSGTCFGGRDQIEMVVNCKKQLLNISVKSKNKKLTFIRNDFIEKWNFEKDLKNIEGQYKLAVWLRNEKQGITITGGASIL